jgi:putative CocE/NonD family hydrolase
MTTRRLVPSLLLSLAVLCAAAGPAHAQLADFKSVRESYTRQDFQIPMRDGVKLYTIVYSPKDDSQKYPMLMTRTPYSIGPYDKKLYRFSLGQNHLVREGYIFVYQDVRGCYMSEGEFDNMRPIVADKKTKKDIDESSDTYDTIDFLLKNVSNHNGKVGLYGISYPGFYSSAGMVQAHPALKAVSPQAPIADWFFDDFHHHGAFFLPHAFNFLAGFGQVRPEPTPNRKFTRLFDYGTTDGYKFFLEMGPLKNADAKYYKGRVPYWNTMAEHPNYDKYWQDRNLLPHLKKVAPAVMTVGGWFDAEDLYGALKTYQAVEKQNPGVFNVIVMGPWAHGQWAGTGTRLGGVAFGADTSAFYQKEMELPFFNHFLKDKGEHQLPEAYMFETGVNKWRKFDVWPPREAAKKRLYFHADGRLSFDRPQGDKDAHDTFVSDPANPVPFTAAKSLGMTREYMTDDQRFATKRKDVLSYQTDVLTEDVTLAGPLMADLRVATSGTDSDWVVKLIDVYPDTYPDDSSEKKMAGYQMMVRSEVIRGRFRNSYEKPEPFVADQPTKVPLELQDTLHTFKKGHRIMFQVCSTWFPLVDRNPQKYVPNIFQADEADFIRATQRVYHSPEQPTSVQIGVLPRK